ncbi:MAG: UTP--glucose-1-phosphate uridylyltransferase [Bryobacteraceae bacterium]|nr:UTP--glucose-1-phosphate uridylyltransferase [Bryobacteraceae bacterium]
MSELVRIITADNAAVRDRSLASICDQASLAQLLEEAAELEKFRRRSANLYERVRALFFISAIFRYYIPAKVQQHRAGHIPYEGHVHLLHRRFEEAVTTFGRTLDSEGPTEAIASALAAAYRGLAFQTLSDQVRKSVRSTRGNQWMFRMGNVLDYPLVLREELLCPQSGLFPVLVESTPVRMDLSHSAWSDIFFLGMDYPEGARVLNISVDLAVRGRGSQVPRPPIQTFFRVIDEPVLRLVSVDLQTHANINTIEEVFDFGRDYLGLLKAAVIASGIVPTGLEGCSQSLASLLARLTGRSGHGIEVVSAVNDIPKGSRLAVSTNLLASLITVCMRATSQVRLLAGSLSESERRLVAARAILGEWLAGSGGGWQDSGGVWPGIKLIEGAIAEPGDPEFGVSRGRLLPQHRILDTSVIAAQTRLSLQDSLVLVHGGMAQDVGPILEMVTERYLLRSETEWQSRKQSQQILREILAALSDGDVEKTAGLTHANYAGPIQSIIPWAGNYYTDQLIASMQQKFGTSFWGFWMLGGMAGGGMGFVFDPAVKPAAKEALAEVMLETKKHLEDAVPFGMDPVVYDFAINEKGTHAEFLAGPEALLCPSYYSLRVPGLLRQELRTLAPAQRTELAAFGTAARFRPEFSVAASTLVEHLLPRDSDQQGEHGQTLDQILDRYGFDRVQHEDISADLKSGRVGLAQNALPKSSRIEDAPQGSWSDGRSAIAESLVQLGKEALQSGSAGLLTLAGGAGSRWTGGAGVVKALHPFCRLGAAYRTFLEVHLAKTRRTSRNWNVQVPHIFTTSYLTHEPIQTHLNLTRNYGYEGHVYVSSGRSIGLRMVPTSRDLRFLWEQTPQQTLDVQKQKVRESGHAALIAWAEKAGEASDYRDNLPSQCLHPVGHWYEFPNMLLNGVLKLALDQNPGLRHLLLHNLDTLGAELDPGLLGMHMQSGAALTVEVIPRTADDHGGGLAQVDGRLRLVEGLAMPDERLEFDLSFYNSATMWLDIDRVLTVFGLDRDSLGDKARVSQGVREVASRMPTYITIKDVKKRWGRGQEDVFPVSQFEKLWGDMTALSDLQSNYIVVSRFRGQQLKQVSQLDGWLRDGSAAWVNRLCDWIP